mgnify:CR=1 FL=1
MPWDWPTKHAYQRQQNFLTHMAHLFKFCDIRTWCQQKKIVQSASFPKFDCKYWLKMAILGQFRPNSCESLSVFELEFSNIDWRCWVVGSVIILHGSKSELRVFEKLSIDTILTLVELNWTLALRSIKVLPHSSWKPLFMVRENGLKISWNFEYVNDNVPSTIEIARLKAWVFDKINWK